MLHYDLERNIEDASPTLEIRLMSDFHRRLMTLLLLMVLHLFASPSLSEEACLKQVFNRFCLDGDINELLQRQPKPLHQQAEGELQAAIYYIGREQVYVMAFRQRIYKVVRRYRPATHLRFQELKALLMDKYGAGEEQSRYPPYVESRTARIAAIRRGEGKAAMLWRPSEQWSVELSWTREMGVALSYIATQLDQQRAALMEQGL
jgi:hypothetical protein